MKEKEKPKTATVTSKVVTIKKGSVVSSQKLEVGRPSARNRLEAVLEAERFRLSSLVVNKKIETRIKKFQYFARNKLKFYKI